MAGEPTATREDTRDWHRWVSPRRPWLWCGLGLLLYTLAGFFLTPWLLERTLIATLKERLALDVRVEQIHFNPFTFTLQVKGLAVDEADGASFASLSDLLVNFELSSLFRWAISFDEVHLTKPHLAIELNPSGSNLIRLAERWQASAPADEPEATPQVSEEGALPRIHIGDLQLIGGGLRFADHRREEPFETELGPINLAVSDLSTLPESNGAQQVRVSGEGGTEIAWTGNLSLNPLRTDGRITLSGSYSPVLYRYLRDQLPFALDRGEVDAGLRYELDLDADGTLRLQLDDIHGTLLGLSINEHDGTPIAQLGHYEIVNGSLQWPAQQVRIDAVRLVDVTLDVVRRKDGSFNLLPVQSQSASEAVASGSGEEPESLPHATADDIAPAPWQVDVGRFELGVSRLLFRDETLTDAQVQAAIDLTLTEISNRPQQSMILDTRVVLASGGTIGATGTLTVLPEFSTALDLEVSDLGLAPAQPYLSEFARILIRSGAIGLTGTLSGGSDAPMAYRGNFQLHDLQLDDQTQQEKLTSLKSLDIDQMEATAAGIEVSRLVLKQPYARIEIDRDGSSNLEQTMVDRPAADELTTEVEAGAVSPAAPFAIAIGAIEVSDGGANFTDLALPLPFEASIVEFGGRLSSLSTRSTTPAELDFEGRVNEWGQVTLSGGLRPWAAREQTQIAVAFRNVDLPRVSPYTIKFAGRQIASGRTDLDLTYALHNGEVEGENHLVVRDLQLGERVEHPDAMSLPLDLAVALLKDSEGKIDLEIPVRGSLDDPEFSYGGAILRVFGNLIVKLVASPFRLLGSLVGIESDDFGAVTFAPGRSDVSPPEQEQLLKLAEALGKRPQLRISVPGVVAEPADSLALARAALESEIDTRLASGTDSAGSDADDELLSKRRQQILEALYDEGGLAPMREELRAAFVAIDEQGVESIDELAYSTALRDALLAARPASAIALTGLAADRARAVTDTLISAGVAEDRITLSQTTTIESDRVVELPLEVVAR